MGEDTFNCDRCGRGFPRRQLKEAFHEQDGQTIKRNLCPTCLDEVMNEAHAVQGVAGDEKQAAVHLHNPTEAAPGNLGEPG